MSLWRRILVCAVKISLIMLILVASLSFHQSPSLSVNCFIMRIGYTGLYRVLPCEQVCLCFSCRTQELELLGSVSWHSTRWGFLLLLFFILWDALCSQCSTTSDAYPWTSVKKTQQTLICVCTFSSVRQAQREIIPKLGKFYIHRTLWTSDHNPLLLKGK